MHHDARIHVELRYDNDTCDIVVVHFRDRGLLPIEVKTWEYSVNAPLLDDDLLHELKAMINQLWLAVYHQD